jgi:uncharacterized metal-binding protein YceD (DUF177 family)
MTIVFSDDVDIDTHVISPLVTQIPPFEFSEDDMRKRSQMCMIFPIEASESLKKHHICTKISIHGRYAILQGIFYPLYTKL